MHIHKEENTNFKELRVLETLIMTLTLTFTNRHNAHILYMTKKQFGR